MWPQIASSIFAGLMLALAAMLLNSPAALLALAVVGMLAWESHRLDGRSNALMSLLGLFLGALVWLYLLYLLVR